MLELIFFIAVIALFYRQLNDLSHGQKRVVPTKKPSPQLSQALDYADRLYKERKFLAAEKAYLEALKLDHRNLVAYSRLGMIYSALKNHVDAIECLQIACQIEPTAAHYHNLGLAFLDNRNNVKAIAALERAVMYQPTAHRYASLAKAYQRASNYHKAIVVLEKAVEMDQDKKYLTQLAEAYASSGQRQKADDSWRRVLMADPADEKALRALGAAASMP